jgi:predicted transposase YbfD/YdcC
MKLTHRKQIEKKITKSSSQLTYHWKTKLKKKQVIKKIKAKIELSRVNPVNSQSLSWDYDNLIEREKNQEVKFSIR